ncbi:MAG TPA: phosphoribosyltransferase family protein [Gemmatimonadales bacterium]|jgi:orotate phosphoribosyltransferase
MTVEHDLLDLVAARRGHFRLESGHHAELWLELDTLFVQPVKLRPLVAQLAASLRDQDIAGVCGPLVGGAFLAQELAGSLNLDFFFTQRVIPSESGELYRAHYGLPATLQNRVSGRRIAIVDDVISAGSAVRGSYAALQACGAHPVVVGALLLLGSAAERHFQSEGLPLNVVSRMDFDLWVPAECPLCAAGIPLEDPSAASSAPARLA